MLTCVSGFEMQYGLKQVKNGNDNPRSFLVALTKVFPPASGSFVGAVAAQLAAI